MAEISITAMPASGLDIPSPLAARYQRRTDGSGVEWTYLVLDLGPDTVRVWPADPVRIRELAQSLLKVADQLEAPK